MKKLLVIGLAFSGASLYGMRSRIYKEKVAFVKRQIEEENNRWSEGGSASLDFILLTISRCFESEHELDAEGQRLLIDALAELFPNWVSISPYGFNVIRTCMYHQGVGVAAVQRLLSYAPNLTFKEAETLREQFEEGSEMSPLHQEKCRILGKFLDSCDSLIRTIMMAALITGGVLVYGLLHNINFF